MGGSGGNPAPCHPFQSRELFETHAELWWSLFCLSRTLANTHWHFLVQGGHCIKPQEMEMLMTLGSETAVLLCSVIPGGRQPLENRLQGVFSHRGQCFSNCIPRNPEVPWTTSGTEAGVRDPEEKGRGTGSPVAKAPGLLPPFRNFCFHLFFMLWFCVLLH